MLVLTRNPGHSIWIGEDAHIQIEVLEVRGQQVRLGIIAPRDMPVHRKEIYFRILDQKKDKEND